MSKLKVAIFVARATRSNAPNMFFVVVVVDRRGKQPHEAMLQCIFLDPFN